MSHLAGSFMTENVEMSTALFKGFETEGKSHLIRPHIFQGKGNVMILGISVSDSASLVQCNGGYVTDSRH